MTTPRKLGILVAIPIKGRKLLNRSGGKQSPYIQLTLSGQKKRTKASLIASVEPEWDQEVRLDVFQGALDMGVSVYDEGKKNELIGEGTLLLHEVIDKGELDVWFPIKHKGATAGDIYFELTFYAVCLQGPLRLFTHACIFTHPCRDQDSSPLVPCPMSHQQPMPMDVPVLPIHLALLALQALDTLHTNTNANTNANTMSTTTITCSGPTPFHRTTLIHLLNRQ
ncbi:hypothetical protein BGX23_002887 [Mortierella sp. AD031]|nr:hypothetical protein BGX23_002887 [Mortierella sp. AD031]